jgi:hypothetical protein
MRFFWIKSTLVTLALCAKIPAVFAATFNEAEVTKTVNLVSLLRAAEAVQPASVGDVVKGQTALRTGRNHVPNWSFLIALSPGWAPRLSSASQGDTRCHPGRWNDAFFLT